TILTGRAQEGDFIETDSGLIFDVKGFIHPPGHVIAFLRYFPDQTGDRTREGITYRKIYSLGARLNYLEENFPELIQYDEIFDRTLSEIPLSRIKIHYQPSVHLHCLAERHGKDPIEQDTVNLANEITEAARIPQKAIGVTGSVLVGLYTPDSDLDLICYGSEASRQVYSTLERLRLDPESAIEPYDEKGLRDLYRFRRKDTEMRYSDFLKVERRKRLQGTYRGRDYYLRLIKDQAEIKSKYGDLRFKQIGRVTIKAVISDDRESIFTPCTYPIKEVKPLDRQSPLIREIVSYRGRFCEQAKKDESIIASGEVEQVVGKSETYCRLILGNRKNDFLTVI
ncbi:MAG: nucleotidyltransferase domain-containing protein, partial [Candidatus Bathyarchaeota archaeon]